MISRKAGGGLQLEIPPSDKTTFVNLKVLRVGENEYGRVEARLGLIAPKKVVYRRHEAMVPDDFADDPELSDSDQDIVDQWAAGDHGPRPPVSE